MSATPDVLELLLPDASPKAHQAARRWVSFMRLVVDDARPASARVVGVDLARASDVLARHVERRVEACLRELLAAHLFAHLERDGRGDWCLGAEPQSGSVQACWGILERFRRDRTFLAGVPEPGESALGVARRLVASLERVASSSEAALWRARIDFAADPSASERVERPLRERLADTDDFAGRARLAAGLAELYLERGALHLAAGLLEDTDDVSLADARLLELRAWTALLRGDVGEARSLRALVGAGSGRLPQALVELRARREGWSELLPGRVCRERSPAAGPDAATATVEPAPVAAGRSALGAAFLAVFGWTPGGAPRPLELDVSPGWRRRIDDWLLDRDDVCAVPGRLEQALVATARGQVVHREDASLPLRGALGGAETLALVLWPIHDARGEVRAWLHLELEHHLVPPETSLDRLARAWRAALSERLVERRPDSAPAVESTLPACDGVPAGDPRGEFFRALVGELAMKTAQRRWWGVVVDGDVQRVVADGGGALGDWRDLPGSALAIERSTNTGGPVAFPETDASLALHRGAGSGVVLPLCVRGRVAGFLAIESERRRDFRDEDVERHFRATTAAAPRLRAASFRAWHRERYGVDLYFDVAGPGFGRRALDLALAGRVSEPTAIAGPPGSGKEVLARWLHFEGARSDTEVFVVRCGASPDEELDEVLHALRDGGDGASPGTVVVKDVDRMGQVEQGRLVGALDGRDRAGTRLVVTLGDALGKAAREGTLLPALAARLERLQFFVPPLCDRRSEIPGLVRHACARFAEEEGGVAPEWSDAAMALLWRQPWSGNLRELEDVVYKLVLLRASDRIEPDDVRAVAERFRLPLLKRLPSRRPRRSDLAAALALTRKRSGNPNKTRAALYLGWDPDTLVARLRDAGIDPDAPFADPVRAG